MATQPQAPFYAPRPSDDPVWQWTPRASDAIRQLAHQKFFGAGGQVPTKLWSPYLYDDPALTWAPAFQNGPVRVTLTQTKFQGQPGQAVTRRWSQFYTYVEPPDWAPTLENLNSGVIPPLSRLGVAKTYRWSRYLYDDPSVWSPAIENLNSAPLQIAGRRPSTKLWRYDFDDPAIWTFTYQSNNPPVAVLPPVKFFPSIYIPNPPDIQGWQWAPYNNITIKPTGKPFVKGPWFFGYDDASTWQVSAETLNSAVIQILSSAGRPPTTRWQFNFDDPALWSFTTQRNLAMVPAAGGKPTATAGQWNYNYDNHGNWQWTPPNTITIQLITYAFSGMYTPEPDDPPIWTWSPHLKAPTPPAPTPFTPRQWVFGLDDAATWQWSVPRAQPLAILSTFRPFSPRFIPTLDEQPGWSGSLRPVPLMITAVAPTPFAPHQWSFGYDDSAIWIGQSHNAFFTQKFPVSFVAAMWNLNIPQDTPQSFYPQPAYALTLPAPVGTTLIQRTLTGVGL